MGLMRHMTLGSLGFLFFLAIAIIKRSGRGKPFKGVFDERWKCGTMDLYRAFLEFDGCAARVV